MENIWEHKFVEKYLHSEDKDKIIAFNKKVSEIYRIHTELIPEPFLGDINSNIVFLNLNPGYSPKDIEFHVGDEDFIKAALDNLKHIYDDNHTFYLLNPDFAEYGGNKYYWAKKLKPLIDLCGYYAVSNSICVLEYFPYHSKKYKSMSEILPSQEYTFYLLREAMKRNALIVIMRGSKRWKNSVPELKDYNNIFELRSCQNVIVSKKNLPEAFETIVSMIKSA